MALAKNGSRVLFVSDDSPMSTDDVLADSNQSLRFNFRQCEHFLKYLLQPYLPAIYGCEKQIDV